MKIPIGGLAGLGLMFMWASALYSWASLTSSSSTAIQTIGLVGAAITSLCGIVVSLYTDSLERKIADLTKTGDNHV